MKKLFMPGLSVVCGWFFLAGACSAGQMITAAKVDSPPVIDGSGDDAVWAQAQAVVTHDDVAGIDVTLKAVYTDGEIFFLVSFPDANESRTHKSWVWDKAEELYKMGVDREDVFVLKWNMAAEPVDLSVYADHPYTADIWFWKACRTDPAGFADDKIQRFSLTELPDSKRIKNRSGQERYLQRLGDAGSEAYKNTLFVAYEGDVMPHFESQEPSGSHADIRAKGLWSKGFWTIEFGRALDTGFQDDVQFMDKDTQYQFGVSRYEIAGRDPEPGSSQPFYGSGDVSEDLYLSFGP